MIRFTLYIQEPKPKKVGVGVLSVDNTKSALFFSGNAGGDSTVLAQMDNVVIVHASSDGILLSGKEFVKTDKDGRKVYKYQEWLLKDG